MVLYKRKVPTRYATYFTKLHLDQNFHCQHLRQNGPVFSKLINEYGQQADPALRKAKVEAKDPVLKAEQNDKIAEVLMQAEERNTGAVTWGTYSRYFRHAGTIAWVPIIIFLLVLNQSSEGMI